MDALNFQISNHPLVKHVKASTGEGGKRLSQGSTIARAKWDMFLTALQALQPHCFFALSQVNHALCHGVGGSGRERSEQNRLPCRQRCVARLLIDQRKEGGNCRCIWRQQKALARPASLPPKACQFTAAGQKAHGHENGIGCQSGICTSASVPCPDFWLRGGDEEAGLVQQHSEPRRQAGSDFFEDRNHFLFGNPKPWAALPHSSGLHRGSQVASRPIAKMSEKA